MEKQDITLSLPQSTLRKAEKIAKDQNCSLSELVVELLTDLIEREDRYTSAMHKHPAVLTQDTNLGTNGSISWTRADLHKRRNRLSP